MPCSLLPHPSKPHRKGMYEGVSHRDTGQRRGDDGIRETSTDVWKMETGLRDLKRRQSQSKRAAELGKAQKIEAVGASRVQAAQK